MFYNTLDRKPHYVKDDVEIVDLTDSIFNTQSSNITCAFYKVTEEMEMRPDLIAVAAFGEDEYTEMVLKYSAVCNPFALQREDIIAVPTLNSVYNEVKDYILQTGSKGNAIYDLVKNYHKYIDKSKIPSSNGTVGSSVSGSKGGSDTLSEVGSLTNQSANTPANEYSNVFPGTTGGSGTGTSAANSGNNAANTGGSGNGGSGSGSDSGPGSGNGYNGGSGSGSGNGYNGGSGSGSGTGTGNNQGNVGEGDYINYNGGTDGAGAVEPNMANNGNNGISIINGRIYFGPNVSVNASDVTDIEGDNSVVNDLVDCAKNGVTIGQFLNATVKNNLKK